MTQATTKDYWISSTALHIELNALGYPDYVQASCVSGAQILVYVKDIIGYDAGHNYRRWPLQASPTVFNSHTEKYVYAAIPRTLDSAASAWIVFPSEQIDIYGKNEKEEQIGEDKYYYIFLQGKITSSGDNGTTQRDWETRCFWGYLSSDEAISAIGTESEWYHYSQADEIVTFLKKLTMKPGTWFRELFAKAVTIVTGGSIAFEGKAGAISGITNTKTPIDSETDIVTPKYLDNNALSRIHKDVAQDIIRFAKGVVFGSNKSKHTITEEGVATLKSLLIGTDGLGISSAGIAILTGIVSKVFKAGADGNGFRLGNYGNTEDSYLEVDRMLVRKAAEFVQLIIRELRHVGGEIVLTPASMKCTSVEMYSRGDIPWTEGSSKPLDFYRCYFKQEQDGTEIVNQFARGDLVRCQTFNIKEGTNNNVKNRYYWRRCVYAGKNFIDLSATEADNDSDVPQAGDEMVQLGNDSDKTRQSAILLSSYGDDAPSFKMYQGISAYSLAGKEEFCVSRKELFALADKFQFKTSEGTTQTFAQLLMTLDGFRSEVKKTYATQDSVKQVSSSIEQTAREISLKVSTAVVERRNLLPGSAFRKQGEGCGFMKAKILCSQKFEGTNIAFADKPQAGGLCWGGGYSRNIHVTKGKRYTLTFMARVLSGSADVLCEIRWEKSATGGSHPAGYAGPAGSANLGVEKIQSAEGWHLYQRSFTVPTNAAYEWVAVWCIKSNSSTANQQVCFAHPILIEGDAKDYVSWGLSPDDYNYIGGNLLDNTRTFAKGGNLTRMDASVVTNESYNNGCSVIYANAASKYIEMAQWSVNTIIKKDEDYILSFMAKGSGSIDAYMWSGTNLSIFAEDSEHSTTSSNADGGRSLPLTDEWKRYWVHWRSEGTGTPNCVLIRCLQGSKAWVTIPKLEVGATPTDWIESKSGYVEDSGLAAKMLRTGLDIENGKITATADKFEVRNNSGEVTASVNKDGLLEVVSGVFSGSLVGVSGTFSKLMHVSDTNVYISFDQTSGGLLLKGFTINDGPMRIMGNLAVDGEMNVGVVRSSGIWSQGSFGALHRVYARIVDEMLSVYYYAGDEVKMFAEKRLKTFTENGETIYSVPCYVDKIHGGFTLTDPDDDFGNGAPIDTFVFEGNRWVNLVYNFAMYDTQKITVLHTTGSPTAKIYVCVCGAKTALNGGVALQLWKAPQGLASPAQSGAGHDVFVVSRYDNNWA